MGKFKNFYVVKFVKGVFNISINEKTKSMDTCINTGFARLTKEEKFNKWDKGGKTKIYPQGCGNILNWQKWNIE